jgi:hypothetical protein
MASKAAHYTIRSKEQNTFNVYKAGGKFYMVANGEEHAKRLVASLTKPKGAKLV